MFLIFWNTNLLSSKLYWFLLHCDFFLIVINAIIKKEFLAIAAVMIDLQVCGESLVKFPKSGQ